MLRRFWGAADIFAAQDRARFYLPGQSILIFIFTGKLIDFYVGCQGEFKLPPPADLWPGY
jgi:hypothetical protein